MTCNTGLVVIMPVIKYVYSFHIHNSFWSFSLRDIIYRLITQYRSLIFFTNSLIRIIIKIMILKIHFLSLYNLLCSAVYVFSARKDQSTPTESALSECGKRGDGSMPYMPPELIASYSDTVRYTTASGIVLYHLVSNNYRKIV